MQYMKWQSVWHTIPAAKLSSVIYTKNQVCNGAEFNIPLDIE